MLIHLLPKYQNKNTKKFIHTFNHTRRCQQQEMLMYLLSISRDSEGRWWLEMH